MNVTYMPLSELKKPERNVRIHTDKQLKEFERSIRMFGQIRPLVVDETNTILAGVGCFETLCRMGAAEAAVYKLTNLTQNQKKKLMIADNKVFSLGVDNLDNLNAFLEELSSDLDIPGYDEEILQSMVAEAEDVAEKIMEYGTVDDTEIEVMKAARAKKEALIEKARDTAEPEQPTSTASQPAPIVHTEPVTTRNSEDEEEDPEPVDIRRFIICPRCGEKVWL